MNEKYRFQKNFKDDATLRKGFNDIVGKTFSLSFESWYQNGYWSERFNPHTLFDGDKAVANISTYEMTFDWNGKIVGWYKLPAKCTNLQIDGDVLYLLDCYNNTYSTLKLPLGS